MNIIRLETVNSTNDYAKINAGRIALPALITADCQTSGRGRQDRSFYSPKDSGLYMTLVTGNVYDSSSVTPLTAVCVRRIIMRDFGIDLKIKWVNDLYLEDRKVCGILCEKFYSNDKQYMCIGIGINLTTEYFPESAGNAGSINLNCDKNELSEKIANEILTELKNKDENRILDEYRSNQYLINEIITYEINGIKYNGTARKIDSDYGLIVENPDKGVVKLQSGEVSVRKE